MTDAFDMTAAPMRIGMVHLKVRDLETVASFYRRVLGLVPMPGPHRGLTLGTGTTPLLSLEGDPTLEPRDPRQPGLFHTAFLLPTRRDLAGWLVHAAAAGVTLQGASDHIVSEAVYLADPEGNGIEVYADQPLSRWHGADGAIRMATNPLDSKGLLACADASTWKGFPEAGRIGHVHLQVGEIAAADAFYGDVLGFDIAARYPGASFYGSGGYHHQLAGNVWNSRRSGPRSERAAGVERVEIVLRDATALAAVASRAAKAGVEVVTGPNCLVLRDPWGTPIGLAA